MEIIRLKNGKEVEYSYDLTRDGIIAYVNEKLTTEEKKEFRSEIRWERDVVKIVFTNSSTYVRNSGKTKEFTTIK